MTLLELTDFWKDISLKHKDIKDFIVGSNYDAATGSDNYPQVFWELPYSITYPSLDKPKYQVQVSLSVYLATKVDSIIDDNYAISLAKEIGDAIIMYGKAKAGLLFMVDAVNAISVREYSDDNCAGMRYDITITTPMIASIAGGCDTVSDSFNE